MLLHHAWHQGREAQPAEMKLWPLVVPSRKKRRGGYGNRAYRQVWRLLSNLDCKRGESLVLFTATTGISVILGKLTWLALAEDHEALSRSLEQLMALRRSVKVKRVPLASLAAKFLAQAACVRAAATVDL